MMDCLRTCVTLRAPLDHPRLRRFASQSRQRRREERSAEEAEMRGEKGDFGVNERDEAADS